ncbi:MAG: hypothetical protein WCB11_11655 [Terriglobales bacterium]
MTSSAGGGKDRPDRAIGRREFLLAAAAPLSSKYLRAQSTSPRTNSALNPATGAASSNPVPKSLLTSNADFFVRNHCKRQRPHK